MQTIDASGLHTMNELLEATQRHGTALIISAASPNVRALMERTGFAESLGFENLCDDIFCALDRARAVLAAKDQEHYVCQAEVRRRKTSESRRLATLHCGFTIHDLPFTIH